MSLWDWAVEAYARPGVADACLELQDRHGQSAGFLLWAAWAGGVEPALLAQAAQAARAWDACAVTPLREVRRTLKPPCPPVEDAARERVRTAVQAAELAAEQLLLQTLEAMTGRRPAGL